MPTHSQIAEAKAHIEVMQAFIEGKPIELMVLPSNGGVYPIKTIAPEWNFLDFEYRVAKPMLPKFDPSICPPWFAGYSRDGGGDWHAYRHKPEIPNETSCKFWIEVAGFHGNIHIPDEYAPKFDGDWKDSWVANPDYKEL